MTAPTTIDYHPNQLDRTKEAHAPTTALVNITDARVPVVSEGTQTKPSPPSPPLATRQNQAPSPKSRMPDLPNAAFSSQRPHEQEQLQQQRHHPSSPPPSPPLCLLTDVAIPPRLSPKQNAQQKSAHEIYLQHDQLPPAPSLSLQPKSLEPSPTLSARGTSKASSLASSASSISHTALQHALNTSPASEPSTAQTAATAPTAVAPPTPPTPPAAFLAELPALNEAQGPPYTMPPLSSSLPPSPPAGSATSPIQPLEDCPKAQPSAHQQHSLQLLSTKRNRISSQDDQQQREYQSSREHQQPEQEQEQVVHGLQFQPQPLAFAPAVVPSAIDTLVLGAGSGSQPPHYRASLPLFGPPPRASTLDVRKTRPGSQISDSSARLQLETQGEGSSRPRKRHIYRRNTYSADVGAVSFNRSDDEMETSELEDARRRMEALKRSSNRRMSKRKKDDDNDRVLIGTRIGEDHVNYVLMYNMLTGIRVSVSRCNAKPQRALVDEDFGAAHKLAFDITGNELTPSSKYDFKFKDYAPWVFRHLRQDFHIDASDYLVSLTSKYILSELGSPGKSGSFFYFSQDYRFIIKTIHHAEHKFMRKILKDYFNHVKQNPHTLLCRFFGLHRVKLPHGRKIHFVVMGNVFPPNRDIHETYDLKGSTLGRAISDEELNGNPRATQKDLNWVNRNKKLELGPVKRHLFVEQTKRDVQLLSRLNIMDYSLLVGIHDIERGNKDNIRDNTLKVFHPDTSAPLAREASRRDKRGSKVTALRMAVKVSDPVALGPSTLPSDSFSERRNCIFYADDGGLLSTSEQNDSGQDLYYLGIIDILTPYNYVKKVEHLWKSLSQDKHAISSVHPKEYAQRFLSFMIHALKVNNDVLEVLDQNSHPHSE
ncbi:Phosphatidylinositol-4-phosphate 5-kinase [Mortierella alpina]|nr:Phosphatidylinositol-4-phosphate 5-kinase [Mortierella alpina]